MKILVDKNKCTGCGTCLEACPKGGVIWSIDKKSKKAVADNLEFCHQCTICAGKCPEQAIKIVRDDNDAKGKF